MYTVKNYNDISDKKKLIDDLFETDFYAMKRNKNALIQKMNHSHSGVLPQYLFLYENDVLIGYFFLIGKENVDDDFPWLSLSNEDELSTELMYFFKDSAIDVCQKCKDEYMVKVVGDLL